MKILFTLWISCSWALAEVPKSLEIIRTIPHSGYSEGIDFHEGFIWNSLPKQIVKIDPADGTVVQRFPSPTDHGESLKWLRGKMVHVSFADNGIYLGSFLTDALSFKKVGKVPEEKAWGIEFNGKELILTGNYSDTLYFLDSKSYALKRSLKTEMKDIEDLAWDGKRLWASSFTLHRGQIFPIDLKTGKVGPFFSLPNPESCPVIDGLAFDGKALWITGKECPALFYAKIPK